MNLFFNLILLSIVAASEPPASAQMADGIGKISEAFQNPPDDSRVIMRWWWFGPSITKEEISRELHAMKDGGIGGVEISQMYPLALDNAADGIKNMPFLSEENLAALPIDQAAGMLRIERVKLADGEQSVLAPRLEAGEKLEAAFTARTSGKSIDPARTRQITGAQGDTISLPADPSGANGVMFFISSRTKQQVMAGDSPPNYKALNERYGERCKPQDMENLPPASSGLTGAISLIQVPTDPGQL